MAKLSHYFSNALNLLGRVVRHRQLVLLVLGLAIGAVAAGAAIGFRDLIGLIQLGALGFESEDVFSLAREQPWWRVLLAPAAGGLLVGLFIHFVMPGRRPQGVAEVMEATALRGGRMGVKAGLGAALASAASIGFGASVGREGPVVHLGATLSSWVSERLHLSRQMSLTLLGCGVASAIAASFNAPIAGVFFALEVVVGHYALSAFAPIVIASVTGAIVSRMHYGDFPAFTLPDHWVIVSFWEFPAFALLGVVSAAAAMCFMRTVMIAETVVARVPLPVWSRPALAGLVIGLTALVFPQVLGVGYEAMDSALQDLYPLWLLLTLIVVKTLATALCLACGFGGGVFSPSLFIGAMVGGAFGFIATDVFPELSSGHGAYTMIGMGAVTGAVLGAPFSTILIIFELTGGYALTIAVMIATVIASTITQQVHGASFFHRVLEKRGLSLSEGPEVSQLRETRVKSIMESAVQSIAIDAPMAEVRDSLKRAPWGELFVVEADGRLAGMITLNEMDEAAFDRSHNAEWTARDVTRPEPAILAMDDDLMTAVNLFSASGEAHLPVVRDRKSMTLVGMAHEHRVLTTYHQAVIRARAEERGEG